MTLKEILIVGIIGALIGASVAGVAQSWRYGTQLKDKDVSYSALVTSHAQEISRINDATARATAQALTAQHTAEQRAAELDQRHTQELAHETDENAKLRALYLGATRDADAAHKRLRIQGVCPAAPAGGADSVPQTGTASGVGNATAIELTDVAGRTVFDTRQGIIDDQAKVRYLQNYIQTQCLQVAP